VRKNATCDIDTDVSDLAIIMPMGVNGRKYELPLEMFCHHEEFGKIDVFGTPTSAASGRELGTTRSRVKC